MDVQERLLVEAVIEAPDSDEPRSVYADWLQQRGDPRGELVSLQLELAANRATPDVVAREAELRDRHAARWLEELGLAPGEGTFVRGFVERVALRDARIDQFLTVLERLARVSPVRAVSFRGAENQVLDVDAASELFDSPCLAHVAELELSCCGFTGDALEPLVKAETSLTTLVLETNLIDVDDLLLLAGAQTLQRLTRLGLADNIVGSAGIAAIATAFPVLGTLDLASNGLDAGDLAGLTRAPCLPALAALELGDNAIGGEVFAMLADAPHLGLARLGLGTNVIEDDGFAAIRLARHLDGLAHLGLADNMIDDAGVAELADALGATQLVTLDLAKNFFTRDGARALASAEHLHGLQQLDTRGNEYLDRRGRKLLASRFGKRVLLDDD